MNINITFGIAPTGMTELTQLVKQLGEKMATFAETLEAVKAQQDLIVAANQATHMLVEEGIKLLQAGQTEELQALFDEVKANSEALVAATLEGTKAAELLDAANG